MQLLYEKNIRVSIVIPVYNRPALVTDAIESVLLQTYENWELIVVDDISTDNTWEVLLEYQNKDKRIKAVKRHREPKGAPTCRNIGADMAQGKYLIFWDSDDLMAPWCVEERVKFMEENGELDFGLFQLLDYNYKNNCITNRYVIKEDDYLKRFLSYENSFGTPAAIWAKKSYVKAGGWSEEALSWQDGDFYIRVLAQGFKYKWGVNMPQGVIRSGLAPNTITANNKIFNLENRLKISLPIFDVLNHYYKNIFFNAIKARIWHEAYNLKMREIQKIGEIALSLGYFCKNDFEVFMKTYKTYSYLRKIPVLRGSFYRKKIKKRFDSYFFFQKETIYKAELEKFINRILLIDKQKKELFFALFPISQLKFKQ